MSQVIEDAMQRMPKELQHPFEDFLIFAHELDESDLDAIVADFVALVKQFKEKLPKKVAELREKGIDVPDFNFPGDVLKASPIDPLIILKELGNTIPAPFDVPFGKALELAEFAPMLPIVNHLKRGEIQDAVTVVMSSAAVLKVTSKFDPEMPRNVLKKVLQSTGFQSALQQMASKLPANLQSPLKTLQSLSQNLEGELDEIMERFEGVMGECKRVFAQRPDIQFPQDLIKSVDPVSILAMIGEKIPPPFSTAYSKALEVAAFAPLMPVVKKLKSKDLEGAVSALFCSCSLLRLLGTVHNGLPSRLVNGVLQSTGFQSALQQAISRTPAQAQSPLEMLQARQQRAAMAAIRC